jgi:hypothetical protein
MSYIRDQFKKYAIGALISVSALAAVDAGFKTVQPENGALKGSLVDVALNNKPWSSNPEYVSQVQAAEEAYTSKMGKVLHLQQAYDRIEAFRVAQLDITTHSAYQPAANAKAQNMHRAMRSMAFEERFKFERALQEIDNQFAEKTLPPAALTAYKARNLLGGQEDPTSFNGAQARDFLVKSYGEAIARSKALRIEKPDMAHFTITPQDCENSLMAKVPGITFKHKPA